MKCESRTIEEAVSHAIKMESYKQTLMLQPDSNAKEGEHGHSKQRPRAVCTVTPTGLRGDHCALHASRRPSRCIGTGDTAGNGGYGCQQEERTCRSFRCCACRCCCSRRVVDTATTHWTLNSALRPWLQKWSSLVGLQTDQVFWLFPNLRDKGNQNGRLSSCTQMTPTLGRL